VEEFESLYLALDENNDTSNAVHLLTVTTNGLSWLAKGGGVLGKA
jgi:hypothetical protein